MKIKDLKLGTYYRIETDPNFAIVKRLFIPTVDEHQSVDAPDTEYIVSEYIESPFNNSERVMGQYILYRKHHGFGEHLSQDLGIFVTKDELLEHIEKQLKSLP